MCIVPLCSRHSRACALEMDQLLALARPTSPSALAVTVLLSFAAVLLPYYFYQIILRPAYFSILRDLPGPTRDSLLYGNLARIFEAPSGEGQAALIRDHGNVVKYGGFFGDDRLLLADPAALQHILVTKSSVALYDPSAADSMQLRVSQAASGAR